MSAPASRDRALMRRARRSIVHNRVLIADIEMRPAGSLLAPIRSLLAAQSRSDAGSPDRAAADRCSVKEATTVLGITEGSARQYFKLFFNKTVSAVR